MAIGEHALVLPFVALENYAYRGASFALDRAGDGKRVNEAVSKLLRDTADPRHPSEMNELSVAVRTYGWNDADMRQRFVCPQLTREWARSVCDNPWAATQQALPINRFKFVDLRRLQDVGTDGPFNCTKESEPLRLLPKTLGEVTIVCRAVVHPMPGNDFHQAVVRVGEHLGAVWMVWGYGQNGESAEAMAHREGRAIVALVQHALGTSENFPALQEAMCRLRRPGSVNSPKGTDC
ncbi:hypothetical protein [Bosea psychrotolerans]|uniref:hypothetical protein n=1 Tax=Bosea psychrotolerans TaxID=1871628 RepID=UPI0011B0EA1C|nr:hypothetical protein [Bosea psychrotolerans]